MRKSEIIRSLQFVVSALVMLSACGYASESAQIEIEWNGISLSLETHNATLKETLEEIGSVAGFKTKWVAVEDDGRRLNLSFKSMPVSIVVEKLTQDANRLIFYTSSANNAEARFISQVWILGYHSESTIEESTLSIDHASGNDLAHEESKPRSEAVLGLVVNRADGVEAEEDRNRIRQRLIQMLQQDEDALVRSRAVLALGALGDEKAVEALEAALMDNNDTVRAQAINALGHIGGDQAAIALGNILLYSNRNVTERVMAAQALWAHGSKEALNYLLLGAADKNEQIKKASTKRPPKPKKIRNTDFEGSRESQ